MSGDFIDSNAFIYLSDDTAPEKRRVAEQLIGSALENGSGCISHQVVQDTLNVMTKKIQPPASANDVRQFLDRVFLPL